MPRPKPKNAATVFVTHGFDLSDEAKQELLQCLGYAEIDLLQEAVDIQMPGSKVVHREPGAPVVIQRQANALPTPKNTDAGKAILEVERAVGFGREGMHNLDEIPRAADYVTALTPVGRKAFQLINSLTALGDYYVDALRIRGADIDAINHALATLLDASAKTINDYKGRSSKGAGKNNGLMEVIRQLRETFQKYYRGPRDERTQRGAFTFSTEQEKRELEFVKTALIAGCLIWNHEATDKTLQRYFRDRRCALAGSQ